MDIKIIGSSSKGNSAAITHGVTTVLVDAGLGFRAMIARMTICGIHPGSVSAILITHEHTDHVAALKGWNSKYNTPVYCNETTAGAIENAGINANWHLFETGTRFEIGKFLVKTFAVPHDAVEPVGYRLESEDDSLGIIADCGHVTPAMMKAVQGVNTLIIEANYDTAMLRAEPSRPWRLKQRIMSTGGHLSNHDAARVVATCAKSGLRRALLGHLSAECNTPEKAIAEVRLALQREGGAEVSVEIAK